MQKSVAMEALSAEFDPALLHSLEGYVEIEELVTQAFNKCAREGDVATSRVAQTFLESVVQACELWGAFRRASRFRLEDRANEHASGKVAGQKHSVSALLGITRNGVYARLSNLGLRPEDFAYLDSVQVLVSRSERLSGLEEQLKAFLKESTPRSTTVSKDTAPKKRRKSVAAGKKAARLPR